MIVVALDNEISESSVIHFKQTHYVKHRKKFDKMFTPLKNNYGY